MHIYTISMTNAHSINIEIWQQCSISAAKYIICGVSGSACFYCTCVMHTYYNWLKIYGTGVTLSLEFLLFVHSGDTARRIGTSNRFNVRLFFFFNKQKGAQFSRVWRYFVFLLIRAHFSSVLSMIETSLVDGIRRFFVVFLFFCSFVCVMEIHTVVYIYMCFTYKCT